MERRYILLTILFAVSAVLVAMGISDLSRAGSQVVVEEINSFGDKSAMEGLKLSIPVGCFEDRLNWETQVVFGESTEVASEVSFTPWAQDNYWGLSKPEPVEIKISVTGNDGHNSYLFHKETPDGDFLAEWNELKAVYDAVSEGGDKLDPSYYETDGQLCLNDYYEYYPLFVKGEVTYIDELFGVNLLGIRITGNFNENEIVTCFQDYGYWVEAEKSDDPIKNLCRGIKYRLWPEYPQNAYVTVEWDDKTQTIWSYVCEMVKKGAWESYNKPSVANPVETYSVSEMSDSDLYYAVDLRLNSGGRPRAETFEEGYGVWRIGYQVAKEKTEMKIRFTEAEPEMIYEMDPEERLVDMVLSENQEELYVFTAKDGICYMAAVDLKDSKETQKVEIATYHSDLIPSICNVFQSENVVAPMLAAGKWGEESSEEKIAVITVDETGKYEPQYVIHKDVDTDSPAYQYQRETYRKYATLWERDAVSVELAYDDGKLAMVYSLTNSYGSNAGGQDGQRPGRFWVAVYDETGVIYAADYQISQAIAEHSKISDRSDICEIRDDVVIGISWGE